MGGGLKYRLIRKFKRIMLRDNTNLFQHIFVKYQTYNWWKLYRKVANEREGGKTYVCSYNGTGDVYLATGLLATKIGPDRVKEATVCVVGGAAKNVASLFGFEDVRALDQAEMNNLMRMCDMLGPENLDIVIVSDKEMDDLITYLKLTEDDSKFVIVSLRHPVTRNAKHLVGVKDLTVEQIVAVGIYFIIPYRQIIRRFDYSSSDPAAMEIMKEAP